MTDINLHQELQNINIKLAETNSDLKALCKKVTAFVDNGSPRCAERMARIEDLEQFKVTFEKGEHAICAAGKARLGDTQKDIASLKSWQRWILGLVLGQACVVIWKFITG